MNPVYTIQPPSCRTDYGSGECNCMKMTRYLLRSTLVGALGGLLFGFDTAVIAGTTQQLTHVYNPTPLTLGITVFIGLVGTVIGAMTAGVLGQRLGGREALRIM